MTGRVRTVVSHWGRQRRPHGVSIGPFTRMRAWWMGVDNVEGFARYGERGLVRTVWVEWRGSVVIGACIAVLLLGRQQSNRANEILDNIEMNRRRYYKRDFAPTYVPNAPNAVYDGARGYSFQDEVTGLLVNADNQLTSEGTRRDLLARVSSAPISASMVTDAQRLLERQRTPT